MIGLGVAAFNVLAAGHIRSDAEEERRRQTGEKGRMLTQSTWERTEDEKKMCTALEKVAKEVGTEHITAVAIAYVMQKMPYVFPIIGGRKVEAINFSSGSVYNALPAPLQRCIEPYTSYILRNSFGPVPTLEPGAELFLLIKLAFSINRNTPSLPPRLPHTANALPSLIHL